MASLIKTILNKYKKENKVHVDNDSTSFSLNKTYKLDDIKICQLAVISNKKQTTLNSRDIVSRIVRYDALMIWVKPNWYMDIESGKMYELGGMFGDELENPNNNYYIAGTEPFEYICYETIKSNGIDINSEYSISEIKQLYKNHQEYQIKGF